MRDYVCAVWTGDYRLNATICRRLLALMRSLAMT